MSKKRGENMFNKKFALIMSVVLAFTIFLSGCGGEEGQKPIRVSNQTWTEASIIGNMTEIMILENTDYEVDRIELESSVLQWSSITTDQIDVWPDYTSTLFMVFEDDETVLYNPDEIYDYVSIKAKEDHDLVMLERMGFYNNYDLAVTQEVAEKYNLETYSDLAEVSDQLTIAADGNFKDRPDVYPLLQEGYGMDFKDIYLMSVATKFTAVENGEADIVACYTTDAGVSRLGLKLLEDDKDMLMHFDSVYVVRGETLEAYPELEEVLNKIKITNEEMAEMNYKVEGQKESPAKVAREFLEEKDLI